MKETEEKNKGITLIGLIVTIIVLLILAGVTVMTLTGDNGLLTKAGEAKNATEQSKLEEEVQLALIEGQTDKYFNSNSKMEEKLKAIFEKSYGQGNIDVTKAGKNYKVKVLNSKTAYRIKPDGTTEQYEEMDPTDVYGKLDDDGVVYLRSTYKDGYTKTTRVDHLGTSSNIKKVIIEEPIAPSGCYRMFYSLNNLEQIENMHYLHTENLKNMDEIFNGCPSLTELDVSRFDTSNVTGAITLNNCPLITELDVSGFDTSNATIIGISGFKALKKLDISAFDTSKATLILFGSNSSLTELDVGHLDVSHVSNMNNMFGGNNSLKKIDLSNFNTISATSMYQVFGACNSLNEIDLSNSDTSNVTRMEALFANCKNLKKLNLIGKFNMDNVTNYGNMFKNVPKDITIKTTGAIASKIRELYTNFTDENFEIVD